MRSVLYSLQFRGHATPTRALGLRLDLTAPSSAFVTTVGAHGVGCRFEDAPGGEAFLRSELLFADGSSFEDSGTVEFGHGNRLRFRSVGGGRLANCPDPHLQHGAVVRRVEGGEGQFDGSEGLITSNFFISDAGEVTDNHLGLIFVHDRPSSGGRKDNDIVNGRTMESERGAMRGTNRIGSALSKLGAVAAMGAVVLLAMPPASATPRGENGRIAFRRYFNQQHTHGAIFTINPDGTGLSRVTHPGPGILTTEPEWSPDGQWIVYWQGTASNLAPDLVSGKGHCLGVQPGARPMQGFCETEAPVSPPERSLPGASQQRRPARGGRSCS